LVRAPGSQRCWSISRIREYPRPEGLGQTARSAESISTFSADEPVTLGEIKWKFD
jgi:hypothetical protein